ncbi:hypothetical protein MMC17_002064 [Xylographa soralifera]|nr:hypothetical protein [Xylographa soralifera]
MTHDSKAHVLVIGAGVIGLQTAVTLLRAGYAVSIVAEYWPGEGQPGYTSDWAGAHWRTHASAEEKELCEWDTETYRVWGEMVKQEEREGRKGEGGLGVYTSLHYWDTQAPEIANGASSLWWSSIVSDLKVIPPSELPDGVYFGVSFSTFAINVPRYLQYLLSCVEALGGRLVHARLPTESGIEAALESARALVGGSSIRAYINASGIGARQIARDEAVEPIRGQTLLVKGEAKCIATRLGKSKDDIRIVIPRPGSGTSIIGVTKEPSIWDTSASEISKQKILYGCKELAPELLRKDGEFELLGTQVGLRPARRGGPRVAAEILGEGELIIHEYGHSGAGWVLFPWR